MRLNQQLWLYQFHKQVEIRQHSRAVKPGSVQVVLISLLFIGLRDRLFV